MTGKKERKEEEGREREDKEGGREERENTRGEEGSIARGGGGRETPLGFCAVIVAHNRSN